MITENEYLTFRKALSILHDYLDASEDVKEEHLKALNKAEDILREFENDIEKD